MKIQNLQKLLTFVQSLISQYNLTFLHSLSKMANKKFIKLTILGGISLGSFFAGTYYARPKSTLFGPAASKPCLPIFGTVSAATPFSPISQENHANRISQIMKYGFPGLDNIRSFDDYVLSYDRRNKVAHWVFEHLSADNTKYNENVDRSKCEFKPDDSLHKFFR